MIALPCVISYDCIRKYKVDVMFPLNSYQVHTSSRDLCLAPCSQFYKYQHYIIQAAATGYVVVGQIILILYNFYIFKRNTRKV